MGNLLRILLLTVLCIVLGLLLLALLPLAWWFLAANHSLVHTFFTGKELSVTVFAVLLWLSSGDAEESASGAP